MCFLEKRKIKKRRKEDEEFLQLFVLFLSVGNEILSNIKTVFTGSCFPLVLFCHTTIFYCYAAGVVERSYLIINYFCFLLYLLDRGLL